MDSPSAVIDAYRREANFARALRRPTPITWGLLGSLLAIHLTFLFLEHSALTPAGHGGLALRRPVYPYRCLDLVFSLVACCTGL